MKTILSILLVITICSSTHSQNKDSLWTSPASRAEVSWLTIASDGTLITAVDDVIPDGTGASDVYTQLSGIDPQTGSVKWKFPVVPSKSSQRFSELNFIPNTPFFELPKGPLTIIDPYDGHVIVDLAKEGISEEAHGYLLQSGHLWVSGSYNGDRCISLFDLTTGNKLWSNSTLLKEANKVASKLSKFAALTGSAVPNKKPIMLLGTPINHGNDKLIVATSNGVFDVRIADGQINWEAELPNPNKGKLIKVEVGIDFLKLIPGRDKFYVVKAAYMTACSYDDGKPLWANPVKTSGPIDQIIYDEKGLILCPGSANVKGIAATGLLKMVNEKTGEELWGDGIKFNGGVKAYAYTDKGLVVVMVNSSSEKNSVNIIDVANGKFLLPKSVGLAGDVKYIELVQKGLLYKTDRAVNVLDLESGEAVYPFPVQSKKEKPIPTADAGDKFYFYSAEDQNVYEINKTTGTGKQLNKAKIEFQGGETPSFIDVRKDGIAVYSEQNVTLIGFDGAAKFNLFNPGVRTAATVLANAVNALNTLNAVMDVAVASDKVAVALDGSTAGRNRYDKANQAFASVGNASYVLNLKQFGSIRNRMKASAQSQDNVVMMTRVDGRPTLVSVSKDSGVIGTKIPLARRDDAPMYLIDDISAVLYYAPKGKNILGWGSRKNAVSAFNIQH